MSSAAATTPGLFDSLFSPSFQTWLREFRQSAKEHSSSLTLEGYLRLIIIVGAYLMLRPYLVKLGGRFQAKDHERDLDDESGDVSSPAAVGVSPNQLRGRPDDYGGGSGLGGEEGSSSEDEGEEEAPRWGRGARRRQKRMLAAKKEEENLKGERNLDKEEADSDREIEEFLRKVID